MKKFKFLIIASTLSGGRFNTNDGAGGCSSCAEAPEDSAPTYLTDKPTVLSSGVAGFVAIHCSIASGFNWADPAAIAAAVAGGLVHGRLNGCRIKGSNGTPSPTTKNVGSCNGDITTSVTNSWSIQDSENDCAFTMDAFYDYIKCTDGFLYGAITCDYRLYTPKAVQNLIAFPVEADSDEECRYWQLNWENKTRRCDPTGMIDVSFMQSGGSDLLKPPAGEKGAAVIERRKAVVDKANS